MMRMQIIINVGYHCVDMTNVLDEGACVKYACRFVAGTLMMHEG